MTSNWNQTTIGEQITLQRGFDITKTQQKPGVVPVISSGGVSSYHDIPMVKGPGVVLGRKGTVGTVFFVNEDYWPHDTTLWVKDFKNNDRRFVYYFFLYFAKRLTNLDVGTANPTLNRNHVHPISVLWPNVSEQREIVRVLSALDNKIDLNHKTNATLEQIAQGLFKSWFVDFDPVKAKAAGRLPEGMDAETAALFPSEFEETELGLIPIGWQVISLERVYEIFDNKRIPLSSNQRAKRQGIYPYYGAASVMDYIDDHLFDGIYLLVGEDGSVIQSNGTPVLQYVWSKFWVNNHAHVLRGKGAICTEHLMLALKGQNIAVFVTGAVQPKLNQSNLARIPFLKPSDEIAMAFADCIAPLFEKLRMNVEQNIALSKLRDSLLPKLISGQLPIPSK